MGKKFDNSGSLGKNQRKEKDSHPDLSGQACINGVDYWISGWKKTGDNGTWYSLAFKPKAEAQGEAQGRKSKFEDDSEIPF